MGRVHLTVSRAEGPEAAGRYRIDTERGTLTLEAGEEPQRRASTRTIVMTASAERPPAVPTRLLTPPSAPVGVPHITGGVVVARAPAVVRPQQVQPELVPTPSSVVALPRTPHDAPSHPAPPSHPHQIVRTLERQQVK